MAKESLNPRKWLNLLVSFLHFLLLFHNPYLRNQCPSSSPCSSSTSSLLTGLTLFFDPSKLPKWNYDGSSKDQAPREDSEVTYKICNLICCWIYLWIDYNCVGRMSEIYFLLLCH